MKKYLLIVATLLTATLSFGQVEKAKMLVDEMAMNVDSAKLAEAKAAIDEALAKVKPNKAAYVYNVAGQVELRYISDLVDKVQRQEELDTAQFITSMDKAVEYFTKSYEIDHTPDAKGRVKPKYDYGERYTIGENSGNIVWMSKIGGYYLISAQLCYAAGDSARAYDYYIKHLDFPKRPMFTEHQRDSFYKSDSRYPLVGYFATIIAFQKKDYDKVLNTVDWAINSDNEMTREDGYHMKSTALLNKGDTARWLETLQSAMENTNNVNYPQIILKYYYDKHEQDKVNEIADEFLKKAPNNKMAHYIKGVLLMDAGHDAESRTYFEKAIEIDSTFVDAVSNLGVTYFNDVRTLNQKATTNNNDPNYKAQQEELKVKLTETRIYFQRVQELAPERPSLWQSRLETIDELLNTVESNLTEIAKRDSNKK